MTTTIYRADAMVFNTLEFATTRLLGDRVLRVESPENGFFGGSLTQQNQTLDIEYFDETVSSDVDFLDSTFYEISIFEEGQTKSGIYAAFAIGASFAGDPTFVYSTFVEGIDILDDLEVGSNLEQFLSQRAGTMTEDPEGFGPGDFVDFDNIESFDQLGAHFGGIDGECARAIAFLYESTYSRMPDLAGLNFWIDVKEAGLSLLEIAGFFLDAPEFVDVFGDPTGLSNQGFVERLFFNILERPGDDPGVDFWTATLDAGRSREQLLIDFALSPENVDSSQYIFGLDETSPGDWEFV